MTDYPKQYIYVLAIAVLVRKMWQTGERGTSGTYVYDALGNRVKHSYLAKDADEITSLVLYNMAGGKVYEEQTKGASTTLLYFIGLGLLPAIRVKKNGTDDPASGTDNETINGVSSSKVITGFTASTLTVQHFDYQGSLRLTTDGTGNLLTTRDYMPFGERAYAWEKEGEKQPEEAFSFYSQDDESGLDYARNRMYDPASGSFTSQDPIRDGYNWYGYCGGDPVNFTDPWGLIALPDDPDIVITSTDGGGNGASTIQATIDYTRIEYITSQCTDPITHKPYTATGKLKTHPYKLPKHRAINFGNPVPPDNQENKKPQIKKDWEDFKDFIITAGKVDFLYLFYFYLNLSNFLKTLNDKTVVPGSENAYQGTPPLFGPAGFMGFTLGFDLSASVLMTDQGLMLVSAGGVVIDASGAVAAVLNGLYFAQMAGGAQSSAREGRSTAEPRNLKEKLALDQAKANPQDGNVLTNITMNDPRWPASEGWVKMSQNINGVEVHYVYNPSTGVAADFKIITTP